jgi:hypothetical protein
MKRNTLQSQSACWIGREYGRHVLLSQRTNTIEQEGLDAEC